MKVKALMDFTHKKAGMFKKDMFYNVEDNQINKDLIYVGYLERIDKINIIEPREVKEDKVVVSTKEFKGKRKTK